MLKKILIALIALAVVIGIGVYYILSNIDTIAKDIIEQSGSEVLGTDVKVGSVSINLREGSATLKHLDVANPAGFSDNSAFSFVEVTAEIEIASGVVKRIYTSQPEIWVEFKEGKSNFDVLQKNIQLAIDKADEGHEGGSQPEENDADKSQPHVEIDEVVVENAKATVVSDDREEPLELNISRLEFVNLRGSPQQIARVALNQFVAQVVQAVARKMIEDKANELIEEQGEKLKDKLKNLLN